MQSKQARTGFEALIPNPNLKLMDQVREVLRLRDACQLVANLRRERDGRGMVGWGSIGLR